MSGIKTVSDGVGRWFALIVLAAGGVALAAPELFAGGTAAVPWLLTLIMLGMGLTLRPADFAVVARRPWALLLGVAAQYLVMPLIDWVSRGRSTCPRRWPPAWCSWAPHRGAPPPT
jgi:BASS family bile acid:Na+ symporter